MRVTCYARMRSNSEPKAASYPALFDHASCSTIHFAVKISNRQTRKLRNTALGNFVEDPENSKLIILKDDDTTDLKKFPHKV